MSIKAYHQRFPALTLLCVCMCVPTCVCVPTRVICAYVHMYMRAVKTTGSGNLLIVVMIVDVNKNSLRMYFPILLKPSMPYQ